MGASTVKITSWKPTDAGVRLVGSNYIPATAINQLEMWQAETFDPQRIDLELGWAESIGLSTMRVFLHDLPQTYLPWDSWQKPYTDRHQSIGGHRLELLFQPARFAIGS